MATTKQPPKKTTTPPKANPTPQKPKEGREEQSPKATPRSLTVEELQNLSQEDLESELNREMDPEEWMDEKTLRLLHGPTTKDYKTSGDFRKDIQKYRDLEQQLMRAEQYHADGNLTDEQYENFVHDTKDKLVPRHRYDQTQKEALRENWNLLHTPQPTEQTAADTTPDDSSPLSSQEGDVPGLDRKKHNRFLEVMKGGLRNAGNVAGQVAKGIYSGLHDEGAWDGQGHQDVQEMGQRIRDMYAVGNLMSAFGVKGMGKALDTYIPRMTDRMNALVDAHRLEYERQYNEALLEMNKDSEAVKKLSPAASIEFMNNWETPIHDMATQISEAIAQGRHPGNLIREFQRMVRDPKMIDALQHAEEREGIAVKLKNQLNALNLTPADLLYQPNATYHEAERNDEIDWENSKLRHDPIRGYENETEVWKNAQDMLKDQLQGSHLLAGTTSVGHKVAGLEGISETEGRVGAQNVLEQLFQGLRIAGWDKDGKATGVSMDGNGYSGQLLSLTLNELLQKNPALANEIGARSREAMKLIHSGDPKNVEIGQNTLHHLLFQPDKNDPKAIAFSREANRIAANIATGFKSTLVHNSPVMSQDTNVTNVINNAPTGPGVSTPETLAIHEEVNRFVQSYNQAVSQGRKDRYGLPILNGYVRDGDNYFSKSPASQAAAEILGSKEEYLKSKGRNIPVLEIRDKKNVRFRTGNALVDDMLLQSLNGPESSYLASGSVSSSINAKTGKMGLAGGIYLPYSTEVIASKYLDLVVSHINDPSYTKLIPSEMMKRIREAMKNDGRFDPNKGFSLTDFGNKYRGILKDWKGLIEKYKKQGIEKAEVRKSSEPVDPIQANRFSINYSSFNGYYADPLNKVTLSENLWNRNTKNREGDTQALKEGLYKPSEF